MKGLSLLVSVYAILFCFLQVAAEENLEAKRIAELSQTNRAEGNDDVVSKIRKHSPKLMKLEEEVIEYNLKMEDRLRKREEISYPNT